MTLRVMFLTPFGFSAERGVGWKEMIGDGERLLVVVAKIGEALVVGCDRVREGERVGWGRRAWGKDGSCGVVAESRWAVVIDVVDRVELAGSCRCA